MRSNPRQVKLSAIFCLSMLAVVLCQVRESFSASQGDGKQMASTANVVQVFSTIQLYKDQAVKKHAKYIMRKLTDYD